MKIHLVIFLFFLCAGVQAQSIYLQDGEQSFDSTNSYLLSIDAYRLDESNAINRDLIQSFLFGGYISNDTKDEVSSNLNDLNNYGGILIGNASIARFSPNKRFGLALSYAYRSIGSFQFSEDLFTLIFYGNQGFLERPANLSSSSLKQFNYQRFSFGLVEKSSGSNISIGIYDNRTYSSISIEETTFKTNFIESGDLNIPDEINITTGSYRSEESNASNLFESGIGFGLNGEYRHALNEHTLIARIEDLGAMLVKDVEIRDTSGVFTYEGFEWELGGNTELKDVFNTLEDSLTPNSRFEDKWIALPTYFSLSYISPRLGQFFLRADAEYRATMDLNPEFGIALNYSLSSKSTFWVRPVIGGYNGFSFGLGAQLFVLDNSILSIGSHHLNGLVDSEGRATSVFIRFIQRL